MNSPLDLARAASGRPDYHVVTKGGATVYTTNCREAAMAWAKVNQRERPGCYVREVVVLVQERTIYRPRPPKPVRDDFAIPAYAGAAA